jgi:hypothetical protein
MGALPLKFGCDHERKRKRVLAKQFVLRFAAESRKQKEDVKSRSANGDG